MNEVRKRIDASNQFILYKVEPKVNKQGETKQEKVPKTYKGSAADYTDSVFIYDASPTSPAAWKPLHDALDAVERSAADGVGISLTDELGITCSDYDHCLDDEGNLIDGNPTAEAAKEALFMFGNSAYWEVSQSGHGLHCFVFGLIPENIAPGQDRPVEMYCRKRYIAMTFMPYEGAPTEPGMDNALQLFYDKYKPAKKAKPTPGTKTKILLSADDTQGLTDEQIIEHLKPKYRDLFEEGYEGKYSSQSEADMALLGEIAFYADGNPDTIDRVFRQSALYREKWDRDDYSRNTIAKVLNGLKETYTSFKERRRQEGLRALTAMTAAGIQDIDIYKMVCDYDPAYRDGFESDTISLGEMYAQFFDNLVRFNTDTDHFFKYSGGVWSPDAGDIVSKELMRRMQRALLRYAMELTDEEQRKWFVYFFGQQIASINKRDQILKDSRGSANTVSYSVFDQQPNLLNCTNGTLNLDTGEFKDHDPNDLLTKSVACAYDPNASTAAMDEFALSLMSGDQELAWYLQRSIGLCAVGEARKDCFWLLIGAPRTGKTTLCNVIRRVMNTYAVSVNRDFLAQSNYKTQNDEELAKIRGARLVVSEELSQNMVLDAAKIKGLTGRAQQSASRKYEHTVDFTPVCKIFIATNYYPTVNDPTLNESNRIKVIEFCNVIPPEEINDHLEDDLLSNSAGVLNWILEGYYSCMELGLAEPAAVKVAIDKFKVKGDKFSRFLEDCLEADPDGKCVSLNDVYSVYRDWCKQQQYEVERPGQFKRIIIDRGLYCESGTTREGTRHNVIKGMRIIQFTEGD